MISLSSKFKNTLLFISVFILFFITLGSGPGTIYIVLGSDTAIWNGMSTGKYNCTYNPALYIDAVTNTSEVMDPQFRGKYKDSYGDTMKLTWWMMTGNIFRYATNNNIPYPNIMTMYLMKEFYGDRIKMLGDELSIHYHTFTWTDYDQDGKYYWNQAKSFMECLDDFNFTLAQMFLEEEVFFVSFRSGWHFMDNGWQNYLNKFLPYSLHNDYPHKRLTTIEPIDNNFDWSVSPSEFIPFNPSPDDYRVQGDSKSWNVRSIHLNNIKNNKALFDSMFTRANRGIDQVACIWGHLPEEDFNSNLGTIDSILHKYETQYPNVKFKYATATEAMQLYRKGTDFTPPALQVEELFSESLVQLNISTDEPIFQENPFVAYKDLNENFKIADCYSTGNNKWTAIIPLKKELVAKAGVVLTDTLGNQSYKIIRYLPDDIFIDNASSGYSEQYGSWTVNSNYTWGNNSRSVLLTENDSAKVTWQFSIGQEGEYHIYSQFPMITPHISNFKFLVHSPSGVDTILFNIDPEKKDWIYLSTKHFIPGSYRIELLANGTGQGGKYLGADVIKISPIVRDKSIQFRNGTLNLGEVPQQDSVIFNLELSNTGTNVLTLSGFNSTQGIVSTNEVFPFTIQPMSTVKLKMRLDAEDVGSYSDTLSIISDDELVPELTIPFFVKLLPFFIIVDNEETDIYHESSGIWSNSVAQAYGSTSRIAYLNQNPRASAYFQKVITREGNYIIQFIVPKTVNAATRAIYQISVNGIRTDSLVIDQNINSGSWVTIGEKYLNANTIVKVDVIDPGGTLKQGEAVLRTDAFKIGLKNPALTTDEGMEMPLNFNLSQNYPNPFNPVTRIKYSIPSNPDQHRTTVIIYDIIGRTIAVLIDEIKTAGIYETVFDASYLASGIYFCKMKTGDYNSVIKMVLIK